MSIANLQTASVGAPVTERGISFFPVYLLGNQLPAIATGETAKLKISELDQASVNNLRIYNPTDTSILVTEGEHFVGGKQNRAPNVSVLISAHTTLSIPVSCLEQGRWGAQQEWGRATSFVSPRVRSKKREGVSRALRSRGSRVGNQGQVWKEVKAMARECRIFSRTGSASEVDEHILRDTGRAKSIAKICDRGVQPQQCGIVVALGSKITDLELFGAPHLLEAHYERLVRSFFSENVDSGEIPLVSDVLAKIQEVHSLDFKERPAVGLGEEWHIATGGVTGQILSLDGSIVHGAVSWRA